MRAVIVALGSRGDVEPKIALAKALQNDGWEVLLLALDDFRDLAASAGVPFTSLQACLPHANHVGPLFSWTMDQAYRHQLIAVEVVQAWVRQIAKSVARAMIDVVDRTDFVIANILTLDAALALRSATGCRVAAAVFAPCLPTAYGVSGLEPLRPSAASRLNRASSWLTWTAGLRWSRPIGMEVRRQLNLPPLSLVGSLRHAEEVPVLLSASKLLVPAAPDWRANVHFTDTWVADEVGGWVPPDALADFLNGGVAPVYVGFGSVGKPSDLQIICEAARRANVRVVAALPRCTSEPMQLVDRQIFLLREAPHHWLFPRTAAVVHHGGSGTTGAALRSGVPSTAIPHQFDQKYFARRLAALGVGPPPLPRPRLTARRLATVLAAITSGPSVECYRRNARALITGPTPATGIADAVRIMRDLARIR